MGAANNNNGIENLGGAITTDASAVSKNRIGPVPMPDTMAMVVGSSHVSQFSPSPLHVKGNSIPRINPFIHPNTKLPIIVLNACSYF